jgi:hypothetical protein
VAGLYQLVLVPRPVRPVHFLCSNHCGRLRILDLDPVIARAGSVAALPMLRDNPLEPELATLPTDGIILNEHEAGEIGPALFKLSITKRGCSLAAA